MVVQLTGHVDSASLKVMSNDPVITPPPSVSLGVGIYLQVKRGNRKVLAVWIST
ncbi:hypothetical protein [Sphingobacterium endophyticum]|uniref:hypothetical protein n=1 Tax=Sphingobacterium endophyticum TaxID=2546448 RepID=UPI0012E1E8A1|nr:hypothetical protein [Sphingobacterium endophyticum]